MRLCLRYEPIDGTSGRLIAQIFDEEPGQHVAADLRRLKQILETGDAATAGRGRA